MAAGLMTMIGAILLDLGVLLETYLVEQQLFDRAVGVSTPTAADGRPLHFLPVDPMPPRPNDARDDEPEGGAPAPEEGEHGEDDGDSSCLMGYNWARWLKWNLKALVTTSAPNWRR